MKRFRLAAGQIRPLAEGRGGCFASDRITVDGLRVGWMYREEPDRPPDSGWRFFSGTESAEYVDAPGNFAIFDVNTIANYDPEIIPLLDAPIGSAFERNSESGHLVSAVPPRESTKQKGTS